MSNPSERLENMKISWKENIKWNGMDCSIFVDKLLDIAQALAEEVKQKDETITRIKQDYHSISMAHAYLLPKLAKQETFIDNLIEHLNYIGWGDAYEREGAVDLMKQVESWEALKGI